MKTFIPKPYKKMQITVRIDEKRLNDIDEISTKFNLSRSEFINQCIGFALDSMENGEMDCNAGNEKIKDNKGESTWRNI